MTKNYLRGKIVEIIFEEMFRDAGEFTIIPLGYEHTTPMLAQYQGYVEVKQVLENIRSAPDFALVSHNQKKVFLVEVKYCNSFTDEDVLRIAKNILERWNPCFLFVASKDNFYFSPCSSIVTNKGEIEILRESWIKKEIQQSYFSLLKDFIT